MAESFPKSPASRATGLSSDRLHTVVLIRNRVEMVGCVPYIAPIFGMLGRIDVFATMFAMKKMGKQK